MLNEVHLRRSVHRADGFDTDVEDSRQEIGDVQHVVGFAGEYLAFFGVPQCPSAVCQNSSESFLGSVAHLSFR